MKSKILLINSIFIVLVSCKKTDTSNWKPLNSEASFTTACNVGKFELVFNHLDSDDILSIVYTDVPSGIEIINEDYKFAQKTINYGTYGDWTGTFPILHFKFNSIPNEPGKLTIYGPDDADSLPSKYHIFEFPILDQDPVSSCFNFSSWTEIISFDFMPKTVSVSGSNEYSFYTNHIQNAFIVVENI